MTVDIFTIATVPEELMQAWLQHLRDFDSAHPGCHFQVMADAPDTPLEKIIEQMQVEPALFFRTLFERASKKP